MNFDAFKTWLEAREYRASTVRSTVLGIEAARKQWTAGVRPSELVQNWHVYHFMHRYSAFLQATGATPDSFGAMCLLHAPHEVNLAPRRGRRKHPAVSVRSDDWAKLVTALSTDSTLEGRTLYAMTATGLRIGDMLGVRRAALVRALETGVLSYEQKGGHMRDLPIAGAIEAWKKLVAGWPPSAPTLAARLTPPRTAQSSGKPIKCNWGAAAGGAAYQRLNRYLKAVCAELEIDGRAYSHRIRRTVAIRALKTTKDPQLVQQLLGHRFLHSTETYIDEIRVDDLVELQKKLNRL